MKPRPTISKARRTRIFNDNDGICHLCKRHIGPGEEWEAEHVKARGFKGSDGDENMRPSHIDCHARKTKTERKSMAKADRQSGHGRKPKSRLSAPRIRREIAPRDDEAHVRRLQRNHAEFLKKSVAKVYGAVPIDPDS